MAASAKPITWRIVLAFYVVWTLIILPWWVSATDRSWPWLVWIVGCIVLPTPCKFLLRAVGYDANPRSWKW
jgi:hypothetical protein